MHEADAAKHDTTEQQVREALANAKRIVVKVGSQSLSTRRDLPEALARQFAVLRQQGRQVVLVSSGAVALGAARLGFASRPKEVAQLQAAASAGQSELMRRYDEAFSAHGLTTAQVLLTHSDLSNRKRLNNARHALSALLAAGAVPIINENDVVATDELRFSDNDHLSAMVAPLVDADALILLTDVDGVLSQSKQRITMLRDASEFVDQGGAGAWGRGGMANKLAAAETARRAGAMVVIASALSDDSVLGALSGQDVGTCFPPVQSVLRARHHWIAYTLHVRGTLLVDDGAARALRQDKRSLLPIGVLGLRGEFRRGDAVCIVGPDGKELGRGLCRLSTLEVARAAGRKGVELGNALGGDAEAVVIHRDDLVLWDS